MTTTTAVTVTTMTISRLITLVATHAGGAA